MMMTHMVISIEISSADPKRGNIFRIFEQAITAVSEKVDTYLRDVSIAGIRIETEKDCLHRIIDIQDELSMIKRVILQQEVVWKSFASKAWPDYWPNGQDGSMNIPKSHWQIWTKQEVEEWEFIQSAESKFKEYYRRLAQLDEDAQRVERSVTAMLDLKSKHATIREAHTSAIMSAAVVGFTIVTIIFTPLSYMASLFALPINTLQDKQYPSRFTSDAGTYRSSYFAKWTVTAEIATFAFTFFCMWVAIKFLLGVSIIRPSLRFIFRPIKAAALQVETLYRRSHLAGNNISSPMKSFFQRKKPNTIDEERGNK
ncbi:uncharacterized protein BDZ99DRAFT_286940 [Mytilinidion resinicola]|uniref:Ankyrin repeat protein n=1 Tax=Mytilinidion resinicola TaxID=574789 RepID=A0A6A6YQ89_9PEZI|nr:uncharacterized protein BDZ99DRAFT_286940 [Mytilinidion resinicola]KAF2810679.1 hypothetical protein BDZ99DRAFT_286940 [Mytilinidion resinicola]